MGYFEVSLLMSNWKNIMDYIVSQIQRCISVADEMIIAGV